MSKENPRPRVVFDAMIYLQAVVSELGPAAALLRLVERGALALFVSRGILAEVRAVLARPKIRKQNHAITDEHVEAFLTRIADQATVVAEIPQRFNYARDPKDEPYINLAIAIEADYLISRDQDLLDLMTGYSDECKDFRRRFRWLKIVEPTEFLKAMEPKVR